MKAQIKPFSYQWFRRLVLTQGKVGYDSETPQTEYFLSISRSTNKLVTRVNSAHYLSSLICFTGLLSDTVQTDLSAIDTINPLTTWSNFGDCSVSCGKGTKKRVIKCQPKGNERNQNCPPGTESYTERVPCTNPSCPGNII